jgi:hypothetical protein
MDRTQAEEDIKLIREVMARSALYTNFSGLSGIIAGTLALLACIATFWITDHVQLSKQNLWYAVTWVLTFVLAISQDYALAQKKARRRGETIWSPATRQVIKAVIPGVFIAFLLSVRALYLGDLDAIPAIWAMGYGAADCAAGMFSVREVRIFGVVQLVTGALALCFFTTWPASLYVLALTFGVYHILFGLWLMQKYGR